MCYSAYLNEQFIRQQKKTKTIFFNNGRPQDTYLAESLLSRYPFIHQGGGRHSEHIESATFLRTKHSNVPSPEDKKADHLFLLKKKHMQTSYPKTNSNLKPSLGGFWRGTLSSFSCSSFDSFILSFSAGKSSRYNVLP